MDLPKYFDTLNHDPVMTNIYLNKYNWKMAQVGVTVIRYANDTVVLEKILELHRNF